MSFPVPTPPDVPALVKVLEAERELEQATSGRPQDPIRLAAALEQAADSCRRWPQATSGVFYLSELLGELAETYERLGRPDDALATMQAAIDAGYAGAPDPRCRLAEILLRAGRAEDAHPIFAEVKADTPADVWLYNNAGLEYGAAGDHERAVAWLTEGLKLAIATGDPERLVAQMAGPGRIAGTCSPLSTPAQGSAPRTHSRRSRRPRAAAAGWCWH